MLLSTETCLTADISIANLNQHACWLPVISLWHHDEWMRTHTGLDGCERSSQVISQKLKEREASLERHLGEDVLPTTFVAHRDGLPIGTVSLVYYQFSNDHTPTEWLTNLFVLPEYRCMGIASELLSIAVRYADEHQLPRLLLYTSDKTDFYLKRNWRSINQGIVQGQKVEIMDYLLADDV